MRACRLLAQLTVYYLVIGVAGVHRARSCGPDLRGYLPVGGVEQLINQPQQESAARPTRGGPRGACRQPRRTACSGWSSAIIGALLTSLPVSWVYMAVRSGDEYDQSLVNTIIVLPMVVTGIVIIVQNSLALAFSLAGIAGRGAVPEFAQELGRRPVHPARGGDRPVGRDRRGRACRGRQHRASTTASRCCGSPNMASARG